MHMLGETVVFGARQRGDATVFRMRGEEVIVRLQRHPALIEIAADHRPVSDRRNHVHEQVPFVVRATVVVVVGD